MDFFEDRFEPNVVLEIQKDWPHKYHAQGEASHQSQKNMNIYIYIYIYKLPYILFCFIFLYKRAVEHPSVVFIQNCKF